MQIHKGFDPIMCCVQASGRARQGREMFVHTHPFLLPINLKSYTTATKKSY